MSYCINPKCPKPQKNLENQLFCSACGSKLLIQEKYRIVKKLGSSNFGATYEVKDKEKAHILNVLHQSSPEAAELFKQEAEVLQNLNNPGIPKLEADCYFTFFPRDSQEPLQCMVMAKIP